MPFLSSDGAILHYSYRAASDGAPTIVFSNSLGTDFRIWDGVVERLPDRFGVVRYDTRGHGLSDLAPAETAAVHAADIAALADAAGARKVVVCGLSIGGVIALQFAADHADRLAALVLCCTGARIGDRALWDARIATVRSDGLAAMVGATMERWFSPAFRAAEPEAIAGMTNMFVRQPAEGYAALSTMLRDTDLTGTLSSITVPTLAIAGALDAATPPELLKGTADEIADAEFVSVDGASHILSVERPDALAATLVRFLTAKGIAGG